MLIKKQGKFKTYLTSAAFVIIILVIFLFRNVFIDFVISVKYKIFYKEPSPTLLLNEREELSALREEVKLLKDENQKLREEFSIGFIDEVRSPIYLLMNNSSLYGDFYTTIPKDKTVYIGMNIFAEGNIAIGQVVEVLKDSLKIERLGQNKTFIANVLDTEESIEFKSLSSGLYAGNIPGGSRASVGDTIVMRGYPKAIVGTVVEITKNDTSLNTVFVRTPYNVDTKEMFYVLQ